MAKRIDELNAHPKSASQPLRNTSLLVARDAALSTDQTRKIELSDARGFTVSITDFGADPTGAADSTAAIQAALDYVDDTSLGGGIVYCPQGEYKISRIVMHAGITLQGVGMGHIGAIGTRFLQMDGVNSSAIVMDELITADSYAHYMAMRDFALLKASGSDTVGSGIYIDAAVAEGTRIDHVWVEGFPEHGIRVEGAAPLYLSDLHLFNNDGYGFYLGPSHSVQTAEVFLISGDNNALGLVGLFGNGNIGFTGVKAECNTAGRQSNIFVLDTTQGTPVYIRNVGIMGLVSWNSIVKVQGSGAQVMIEGLGISPGSVLPTYIIHDAAGGTSVSMEDFTITTGNTKYPFFLLHSWGREVFRLNRIGMTASFGADPVGIVDGSDTSFGIGVTTGIGNGAVGSLQAHALGSGSGPASPVVNKWVRAVHGNTQGWIPFFV